jgi:hypothetical protein
MKKIDVCSESLSRRSMLAAAGWFVGASAVAVAVATATGANAQAKVTPTAVAYQDSPKGAQQCDNCNWFQAPNACKTVAGEISPQGWCKIYARKPA